MQKPIHEIFRLAQEAKTIDQRVKIFQDNDNVVLRTVLKGMFDKDIKFLLPEGPIPKDFYKPNDFDEPLRLYREVKKFYLFVEGGHPNLNPRKREELFLTLMNSLDPKEGEVVIAMKDKKPPKNITEALVRKAFPNLL